MNFTDNIVLENNLVLLRPLTSEDEAGLSKISFDPDIWSFFVTRASDPDELKEFSNTALEDRKRTFRYPFTIIDKPSGEIAGSTSYGNISVKDKRLKSDGRGWEKNSREQE